MQLDGIGASSDQLGEGALGPRAPVQAKRIDHPLQDADLPEISVTARSRADRVRTVPYCRPAVSSSPNTRRGDFNDSSSTPVVVRGPNSQPADGSRPNPSLIALRSNSYVATGQPAALHLKLACSKLR